MCTEGVCDDQQDEDLDGLIDCDDPDCAIATVCQRECVDMSTNDLGSAMGMSVAMGTNIGMLDDFKVNYDGYEGRCHILVRLQQIVPIRSDHKL